MSLFQQNRNNLGYLHLQINQQSLDIQNIIDFIKQTA